MTATPNQALQRTGLRLVAARPLSRVVSVSFMRGLGLSLSLIRSAMLAPPEMKAVLLHLLLAVSALTALAEDEANQAILKLKEPFAALRDEQWRPTQAIAIGDFYSVAFLTKPAQEFLAEYFQRVFLFGGTARTGDFLQAFQLRMNTGGRTHMLLYRHLDSKNQLQFVTFQDRYREQTINIPKRDFHPEGEPLPPNLKKEFIGTFSGEAPPNKFLTPLVMSEAEATKQLK